MSFAEIGGSKSISADVIMINIRLFGMENRNSGTSNTGNGGGPNNGSGSGGNKKGPGNSSPKSKVCK